MTDILRLLDMFNLYAVGIDFNRPSAENHFQYKMLKQEIELLEGIKLKEVSEGYLNNSLQSLKTNRMKIYYLIKCVTDDKVRTELTRIQDEKKDKSDLKLVKFNAKTWGFVPV